MYLEFKVYCEHDFQVGRFSDPDGKNPWEGKYCRRCNVCWTREDYPKGKPDVVIGRVKIGYKPNPNYPELT